MPVWSIVLIAAFAVLVINGVIHRHVLVALFKHKPFKAPKWHVWLPKKIRVS